MRIPKFTSVERAVFDSGDIHVFYNSKSDVFGIEYLADMSHAQDISDVLSHYVGWEHVYGDPKSDSFIFDAPKHKKVIIPGLHDVCIPYKAARRYFVGENGVFKCESCCTFSYTLRNRGFCADHSPLRPKTEAIVKLHQYLIENRFILDEIMYINDVGYGCKTNYATEDEIEKIANKFAELYIEDEHTYRELQDLPDGTRFKFRGIGADKLMEFEVLRQGCDLFRNIESGEYVRLVTDLYIIVDE